MHACSMCARRVQELMGNPMGDPTVIPKGPFMTTKSQRGNPQILEILPHMGSLDWPVALSVSHTPRWRTTSPLWVGRPPILPWVARWRPGRVTLGPGRTYSAILNI